MRQHQKRVEPFDFLILRHGIIAVMGRPHKAERMNWDTRRMRERPRSRMKRDRIATILFDQVGIPKIEVFVRDGEDASTVSWGELDKAWKAFLRWSLFQRPDVLTIQGNAFVGKKWADVQAEVREAKRKKAAAKESPEEVKEETKVSAKERKARRKIIKS